MDIYVSVQQAKLVTGFNLLLGVMVALMIVNCFKEKILLCIDFLYSVRTF